MLLLFDLVWVLYSRIFKFLSVFQIFFEFFHLFVTILDKDLLCSVFLLSFAVLMFENLHAYFSVPLPNWPWIPTDPIVKSGFKQCVRSQQGPVFYDIMELHSRPLSCFFLMCATMQYFAALAFDCKWFSAFDVADAYYNIPVDPKHRHKLTIATPLGNYCYNYLPMDLASNSCYYQRLRNEAISNNPQVFCYLDDIIVMSKNLKDHKQTLRQVFARLRDYGSVIKASKCIVAAQSLSSLDYHVSSDGISPLPNKIADILEFKLPRTKKQLMTYLGMYQFYARFVKGCSQ